MRAFRRPRPQCINPRFQCQLGHVTHGHAFLLAVCIIMLRMLAVTAEHAHLAATDHMNPMDQWCIHPRHMTFKHAPLMLPSLNNVLPTMALQNEIVKSNIWCLSCSSSHARVCCVSSSQGFSVLSGLGRMVVGAVVVLLLLMCGDIETNPGPVGNMLTSEDLGCVLGEVLDVSADWYDLGLQLKVRTGTLDNIRADFTAAKHRLREMLKAWLTTGDNPSWKILIDALKSRMVGASQLAAALEKMYCPIGRTELDVGGHPETNIFPPSPVSLPLQETDIQETMRTSPYPHPSPVIDKPTPPETQAAIEIPHPPLPHKYTQGPLYNYELNIFKLYFSKLVESISHPEQLAVQLYSHGLINKAARDEAMHIIGSPAPYRASKLVAAVEDQIMVDSSVLWKFLSMVRRDSSLVYIADAMSDHYRSVLPPKDASTSLPTLSQLSTELRDFKKWYLLGLKLNISKDTLSFIAKMHDTADRQCFEMLQHWISNSEKPTLEAIHEALKNIGESVIAEEIARKYNIRPTVFREENLPPPSSEHLSSRSEQVSESSGPTKALKPRKVISREQRRIINYFAIVMDKITEVIETVVKLEKLLRFLRFLCHPLNPEMTYIDQHILKGTSSVSEVMESLVPEYINYMETGLLEAIIERFECTKAESLLQEYHDRYPNNRLLIDMPNPVPDERLDLTRRKRLRVECNGDIVFESARAFDVKRIRTAIEDATGIDHQIVTHAQHSEGCLKLTFLIPESVSCIFQELCDEDLEILADAGIVELQIDDFVISDIRKYCPQKIECSTQSIDAPSAGQSGTIVKGFDSYIDQRAEHFTSKEKGQLKRFLESIPKSRMKELCSDSFLQQLATHMRDWRELAPHFGFSELKEKELAYHYPDVGEQRYRALDYWKQINPDNATYKELIACLLVHAPFDLAEAALKMLTPDAALQETRKLLQKAYLSEESLPLWTGAPELLQFDRRLGKVTEDTDKQLREIDYSSHFETLEHFSSEIETVSIKSFVNSVAKKKDRFFLIKGPPSSGRTTLLQRVCAFWARGFCLRKFTLVLWLDLRAHPSAPSDVSLRALLNSSLPRGSHLDSIQQWLERHGTQDVLIMVDGAEAQACSEWELLLVLLVKKTEASLVLTATSPIQIKDLTKSNRNLHQYDLLGLSQDHISKQVIHHYCHNTARAEEFLIYISEAHDIRALCSSPPYLAAVLFVFDNVSASDLPITWTQLFSILKCSLFPLSGVSDHNTLARLTSKAYAVITTNTTLKWHHNYTNFCSRVPPLYLTIVATAKRCYFTLPLLQYYFCAQHIHSLPHDQHVPALHKKTVPLHVRRFYIGLCNSSVRAKVILTHNDTFMNAACVPEVAIEKLQDLMTSQLTFKNQLLTSFDIHRIFQTVYYSGLKCKLKFHQCHFVSLTLEMMVRWLRADSILPSDGAVQELSLSGNQIKEEGARALCEALQVNQILQKLNLSGNQIKEEGARALCEALQVNQSLQKLNLSGNQIKEEGARALCEALRVNQSLQKLNLSGNQIKEGARALCEDLRVNQILQKLNLSGNQIKEEGARALCEALRVNQSLQKLDLSGNQIKEEGARALCEALRVNQSLQKLNLSGNQIKEEGARALCEALQVNQSLQKLNLSGNQISDNGACELAAALQVNQSLQELNLSNNKISADGVCALLGALLVSQNLQKVKLDLSENESSAEGVYSVFVGLQENPSLQKLDLSNKHISDKGVDTLSGVVRVNQSLQKLDLSGNQIKEEGARALCEALRVNQSLQKLNLSGNQIKEEGARALCEALRVNQNLQKLNLSGNQIKEEGARALCEALRVNQNLQKLNLSGNQIKEEGARALCEALRVNQSLQKLNLSGNQIKEEGARALCEAFRVNQSLQKLNLSGNQIKEEGARALCEALQVNQSLQKLNLSGNQISDNGACELAAALQVNQSLQELNLSNNKISADGVCALLGALLVSQNLQKVKLDLSENESSAEGVYSVFVGLQENPSLQKLDLSNKHISDKGVDTLSGVVRVNQSLQELDLSGNKISAEGTRTLAEALHLNQSLRELNLSNNEITSDGVHELTGALQVNQSLQRLNLSGNKISAEGTRTLAEALHVNQSLRELNLGSNQISDEGAHAVATALKVNQSLQELNLRDNMISAKGVCALVRVFQVNQNLQKLKLGLSENKSSDELVCALVRELQVNQSHQKLDLSSKEISDEGACALSTALQVNQSLQELDLSGNQISAEGIRTLAEALHVNQSLRELNLSGNQISNEGACELAAALQVNQSLQTLDLSGNKISAEGTRTLAEALHVNQSLRELNLRNNEISADGVLVLAGALIVNKNLKLDLSKNGISEERLRVLVEALKVNQSHQKLKLNLSFNQITDKGACTIATVLQVNQSLQELNLSRNQISGEGARELATALRVNQSLQTLNLSRNQISDEGARELATALQVNQSLQTLNVRLNYISSRGRSALWEAELKRKNLNVEGLDWQH